MSRGYLKSDIFKEFWFGCNYKVIHESLLPHKFEDNTKFRGKIDKYQH